MHPFTTHTGLVAPSGPVERRYRSRSFRSSFSSGSSGPALGTFLFFDWRFRNDGTANPEFVLNRPEYAGASVLLTRRNFGCGSSREHAPWALENYGFRVIIAPSFADIFYNNCFKNGMLPIRLDEAAVDDLFARCAAHPGYKLTVDLEKCVISDACGLSLPFEVDALPPPLSAGRARRHRPDARARAGDRRLRAGARNR